ncbi:MAG: hypothetical protein AB1414_17835 [bacterium]
MSIKISLYFKRYLNLDLIEKGVKIEMIRLIGGVRFRARDGWTELSPAIVDTGAPVSTLPKRIWSECQVHKLAEYELRGVVPRKECFLPVVVGEIGCVLVDEEAVSNELLIKAYLADTDEIPPLIGFAGLLDKFKINIDYLENKAYLEQK